MKFKLMLLGDMERCAILAKSFVTLVQYDIIIAPTTNFETVSDFNPDCILSYGLRDKLSLPILLTPRYGCYNLHSSYLPWNKGADPNFWSWVEHTPKGVTIHEMTGGIDDGPIVDQVLIPDCDLQGTLRSSYEQLHETIQELFRLTWPRMLTSFLHGVPLRMTPQQPGTRHYTHHLDRYRHLLTNGWDTPLDVLNKIHIDHFGDHEPAKEYAR